MSRHTESGAIPRRQVTLLGALALAAAIAASVLVTNCGGGNNNAKGAAGNSNSVGTQNDSEPILAAQTSATLAATSPIPAPLYGVTIDDISELPSIVESLKGFRASLRPASYSMKPWALPIIERRRSRCHRSAG